MSGAVVIGDRVIVGPRRSRLPVLGRMLIVVSLGLLAGAADSWIRPIKLAASNPAAGSVNSSVVSGPVTTPVQGETPASTAADPGAASTTATAPGSAQAPADRTPMSVAADEPLGLHITLIQARKLFEAGKPFLDARTEEEFKAGHIAGAFHLPSDAFSRAGGAEALKFIDQNDDVVIYCGGGECHASEYVAIELEKAGFKKYHIMVDGFPKWKDAGYDVAVGAQ